MVRLPLLMLLLLVAATALRADIIYNEPEMEITNERAGRLPLSAMKAAPGTEVAICALVSNLRSSPSATGQYIDADGTRRLMSRPGLQFLLAGEEGDTLRVCVSSAPRLHESGEKEQFIIEIFLDNESLDHRVVSEAPEAPFHIGKEDVISLSVSAAGSISVFEGEMGQTLLATFESYALRQFCSAGITAAGVAAMPGGRLKLHREALITAEDADEELFTPLDTSTINLLVATSTDPYEGYWSLMDYTTDDAELMSGGDYRFALLGLRSGGYRLIYLSGAVKNPSRWTPGCVKAIFTPAALPGIYSVRWIDAEGEDLDPAAQVQLHNTSELTIQFPTLLSTLRLHKTLPPK